MQAVDHSPVSNDHHHDEDRDDHQHHEYDEHDADDHGHDGHDDEYDDHDHLKDRELAKRQLTGSFHLHKGFIFDIFCCFYIQGGFVN